MGLRFGGTLSAVRAPFVALMVAACGAALPSRVTPATPPRPDAPPPRTASAALPALTDAERAYRAELERHVQALSVQMGERNTTEKWNLATAADYIAGEFEKAGYEIGRQGYAVGETVSQNLAVDVRGGIRGEEIVLVGAHYDSAVGTPGANDNASGTAALLSLAATYREKRPLRRVRFVAFANEEAPHFQTPTMGSLVYAREAAGRGERIVMALSLETIGYYSDEPGSQKYPDGLAARFPDVGNFVAVVGSSEMAVHVERVAAAFRASASIPAEAAALPADLPGVAWSDHWSFWQMGFPALMITDTAPFRYPHYHQPTDTADRLDYDRMARVVAGVEAVIDVLAGTSTPEP